MRVILFIIIATVAFGLPCVELPEWARIYDDATNDFVLLTSRVERPDCAAAAPTLRLRAAHLDRGDSLLVILAPSLAAIPIAGESHSLMVLLTVQKK